MPPLLTRGGEDAAQARLVITRGEHVRLVGSAAQEAGGFEKIENRLACDAVEIPKSLCLSRREPEPRHLAVFRSDDSQKVSHVALKCRH